MSPENKVYDEKMLKTIEVVKANFASVRAGRANAGVLDRILVEYYGTPTPLNQVAAISSPDPRTLVIQPWDGSLLKAIEKAIQTSDLGINPQNDGRVIRLAFPQLTEERRKELVKQIRKYAENGKVAIRNIRRDAMESFKKKEKASEITEDDLKQAEKDLQKLTDDSSKKIDELLARKEKVCATLRGGLEKACASLGVRLLKGRGSLVHAGLVEASTAEGPVSVEGDRVILATGSGALELPGLPVDHTHILTSDDALALDRVPASIAIVGGGVIGCELAFIYQAFGSKVTVVEGQNRLLPLPSVDADMSALLQREMKKRRIGCELGRTLKDVRVEGGMVRAMLGASPFIKEPTPAQMKETPIEAETVLVTVGRAPNTAGLGLAEAGVAVDGRGWIRADEHMRTSLPGVYAVGDALGPSRIMLAHVAAAEGLCAVRDCLGHDGRMDYSAVPSGIFTSPEIGCVGLAEAQASEAGRDVRTATFQMRELGKAQAMSELPGMFKIVSDGATGKVLGVHIAGAHATDLIAEAGLALRLGASVRDIAATIHAHPTLAEGLYEAALSLVEADG